MPVDAAKLAPITSRLQDIRAKIRRLYLIDGTARLVAALAAFVVVTFLLDYRLILPKEVRLVFLFAGLGAFGWVIAKRLAYPMRVKITDDDLALFVERHYPQLADRLISALQLSRSSEADETAEERIAGFNSPELVEALVDDASKAADEIDFNSVLVRTHVMKRAGWAALAAALVLGAGVATADTRNLSVIYAKRAVGFDTRWPQRTYLQVIDFDPKTRERTIARGEDLPVAVAVKGEKPRKVRLDYTFGTGERGRETLTETSDGIFLYTFTQVPGPFTFKVSGGDDTSDDHTVIVKNPPSIEEMRLFMAYPEYLKMRNTPEDQPVLGGTIQAPQFTNVRFIAVCNEDIGEATLRVGPKGKEKDSALVVNKDAAGLPRLVTGTLTVDEPFSKYQIELRAVNGLKNRDVISYDIRGMVDAPPAVVVHDPAGEENVTEVCERPIIAQVKDDHGIAEIVFEWRKDGKVSTDWTPVPMGAEHLRPVAYGPDVREMEIQHVLNFAPIGAVPGEYVRVRFRAFDFRDVGGRNERISKEYRFTIVPLTQLEKELQDQLEKVKQNLEALRKRQQTLYEGTARLSAKYANVDQLNAEQAGEMRYAGNEQSGVTEKLKSARTDIERIRRRGVWNKIFDERAAGELGNAVEALDVAIAERGPSLIASSLFWNASRERKDTRSRLLNDARGFQSQVITAIDNALRFLDKWSTYQEIVRLVRSALEEQDKINDRIKGK